MLEIKWQALRPESEIDYIRARLAAELSNDFGTEWREDELYYEVVDDEHFVNGKYDPIVKATLSFVAVCYIEPSEAEVFIYWYERFLKEKLSIDDVCIEFRRANNDWSEWRPTVG